MKIQSIALVLLTAFMCSAASVKAQSMDKEHTVMVGGAAMYPSKNIVENAMQSKDHTTLVAAVKAAGLVETLQGKGPFTVLAPTNAAFDKLPKETVQQLLQPDHKDDLVKILTYHVLPGKWNAEQIRQAVKKGGGKYVVKTVQGESLSFWEKGDKMYVSDMKGNSALITIADVHQSNGVIHVIDTVLMP
jgi:uncharacterized surface protein with fasciclin (FAS1) repeats